MGPPSNPGTSISQGRWPEFIMITPPLRSGRSAAVTTPGRPVTVTMTSAVRTASALSGTSIPSRTARNWRTGWGSATDTVEKKFRKYMATPRPTEP